MKVKSFEIGGLVAVAAIIGNGMVVVSPDEAEKLSVDLWVAANDAKRIAATLRDGSAKAKQSIRPRRTRKGKIPLTS